MKIYIVTAGIYSCYKIKAVFTDKQKALTYCAVHNKDRFSQYRVETYNTSDDRINGEPKIWYLYIKDRPYDNPIVCQKGFKLKGLCEPDECVWLEKKNDAKAKKIFRERDAK